MSTVAGSFTKKEQIYRLLEDVREQMVSRQTKAMKRLQAQIDYKDGVRAVVRSWMLDCFFCFILAVCVFMSR